MTVNALTARNPSWPQQLIAFPALAIAAFQVLTGAGFYWAVALPLGISLAAGVLGILVDVHVVAPWPATFALGQLLLIISFPVDGLAGIACAVGGIALVCVAGFRMRRNGGDQ